MRVSDPEDLAVIRSLSRTLAAVWVELTDEKSIPFGPGARAAIDKRLIDAVRTLKLEVELHRAAQAAIEDDARTTEGESLRETVTAPASVWHYEKPKHGGGPKTLLLTIGGIAIIGNWRGELGEAFVAWAALPKRDKAVERAVLAASKEKKA
ncbi:hypothetical protein BG60_26395 [Caballeronia zhejiangensis]|uniref:Uncharacterized protein n=2 Tax=Caballeronia zhejiangensis TaxID=871203 RepID=A0A656QCM4_9BURK|nr:hypothetical protein BG60_26395 [Caballeronia zhejiangensis]